MSMRTLLFVVLALSLFLAAQPVVRVAALTSSTELDSYKREAAREAVDTDLLNAARSACYRSWRSQKEIEDCVNHQIEPHKRERSRSGVGASQSSSGDTAGSKGKARPKFKYCPQRLPDGSMFRARCAEEN